MLDRYSIRTSDDLRNAQHEVMQQITLAALNRAGFFNDAAFYGGTCLRIFHGLQRFSEDMDFSLLEKNSEFTLEAYFDAILKEFSACGRKVTITRKTKNRETEIESAFLKENTDIYNIEFQTEKAVKIKIEVDKNPPQNFTTESKLLLLPYSFMTRCFTLPGLFAGKMHALLFRNWSNRVKGRDWYDLEWYVRKGIPVDFNHFLERTHQGGNVVNQEFTKEVCIELLKKRIENTNIAMVKNDVLPFLKNRQETELWSTDYFMQIADMITFQE
jgi:predicted nucleotidyltransferase component of viral defense system